MKNYSLNFQVVFNSIEELQEIFKDVLEQLKNESLDEHPNCLTSTYDFDVLKINNKDVLKFKSKLKLYNLLSKTDAFVKYEEDYESIFINLEDFVSMSDINYKQIVQLLVDIIEWK